MGFAELFMIAVQGISTILNNPLLGGQASATARQASELLAILGSLVQKGDEAYEELRAFASIIKAMADEGRGPTREERQFLREQRAIVHAGYQAEKERILARQREEAAEENPSPTEGEGGEGEGGEGGEGGGNAPTPSVEDRIAELEAIESERDLTEEEQQQLQALRDSLTE